MGSAPPARRNFSVAGWHSFAASSLSHPPSCFGPSQASTPVTPAVPHGYLASTGVEPRAQGAGIGRALLEPALTKDDKSQTLCYLGTPYPETHAFYAKSGFELTTELQPVAGAPSVWTMTRPAQNASPAEIDDQARLDELRVCEAWPNMGG